jgi:hypothetical protein
MAPRIINLDEWARHVIDRLRQEVLNIPNGRLDALVNELEALVPDRPRQPGPDYLGFAVPLRLRSGDGELRLLTTLTHFDTAVDVTVAELRLEAFLPVDEPTAAALKAMAGATTSTNVAQQLQCSYDDSALHPLFPVVAGPAAAARQRHDGC